MRTRHLCLGAILVSSGFFWEGCPVNSRQYLVRGICADLQAPENLALRLRVQVAGDVNCHFDIVDGGRTAELLVEGDWNDLDDGARQFKTFLPIEQDCEAELPLQQDTAVEGLRYFGQGEVMGENQDGTVRYVVETVEVALERNGTSFYPRLGPDARGQVECHLDSDGDSVCCLPIEKVPDGGRIDAGGP